MGPQGGASSPEVMHHSKTVSLYAWLGIFSLMFLILSVALLQVSLAAPGTWNYTQSMSENRECHSATLLPNGKVLVVGGYTTSDHQQVIFKLASGAELYDPATGTWSQAQSPPWGAGPGCNTATLLPSGEVFIFADNGISQIYNPVTDSWRQASGDPVGSDYSAATLLTDGRVLVTGGEYETSWTATFFRCSWLLDPVTGQGAGQIPMEYECRSRHTSTLLPNGKVLVTGGLSAPLNSSGPTDTDTAMLFDRTATKDWDYWSYTASMYYHREKHTATLLRNGKVLIHGGTYNTVDRAELYDPDAETMTLTGDFTYDRVQHTATLLPNGKVLMAGGTIYAPEQIYDPDTETWTDTGSMGTRRILHTATLLPDGRVLVTGGRHLDSSDTNALNTAELYEPEPPPKVSLPPLLAFYPFDLNVNDVSGNGRDGTIAYPPLWLVPGYEAQAFAFNTNASPVPDYITVNLDINPSMHPRLTMGAWAKTKSGGSLQPLITHDNGSLDRQIGIDVRGNGIGWSAFCGPTGGILGAVPSVNGKWTFVAAVYDQVAQTVKLQVDDMVLTKGGVTLGPGESKLYIGGNPTFYDFFDGIIDNVFIFGDALTDKQLAYIRSNGAAAILAAAISNKCAAILYDDLSLRIPAIVFNGQYYWADFQYVKNTMDFVLSYAGLINDTSPFSGCTASSLSASLQLNVPVIVYGGVSYWADLQYTQGVTFTLVGAGQNRVLKRPR